MARSVFKRLAKMDIQEVRNSRTGNPVKKWNFQHATMEGQVFQSYAEYREVSCLLIESLRATFAWSRTRNLFANVASNIGTAAGP